MNPKDFGSNATSLSRNPLGIIALFITLIYAFASLVVAFGPKMQVWEKAPLIWFLIIFPILVLVLFAWLVSKHHLKLYSPSDFRGDTPFLQASKVKIEVATALAAAAGRRIESGESPDDVIADTHAATTIIDNAVTESAVAAERRVILWVDDRPKSNSFERKALEYIGFRFVLATTTEQAMDLLKVQRFDLIISDMSRPGDPRAGFTLLDAVRGLGNTVPFLIYTGSKALEHRPEASRRGAQGTTNRPNQLLEMVMRSLGVAA